MVKKRTTAVTALLLLVALLLGLAVLPRLARGQNDGMKPDGTWQLILAQQLQGERQCKLDHIVAVRQFELAGDAVVEGRVRCADGREFDFSRAKMHLKFEIRLCQPAIC